MGHFFYRVSRDQDIIGFLKEIFWRFKWKWKQFKMGQLHTLESSVNQNQGLVKFIYSEKATKFCENYFWLALHWTSRWRFRKNLWPSQNIWILSGTEPRYNFGIGIGAETFLLGPLLSCQKNSKTNSHVFTLFGVIYICRSLKWTMILKKKLKNSDLATSLVSGALLWWKKLATRLFLSGFCICYSISKFGFRFWYWT